MNTIDPTRATLDERYSAAGNSHNLTSTPEHQTQADVLGASGMSRSPVGATLQRLQGEWDAAVKPHARAGDSELRALMRRLHSLPEAMVSVQALAIRDGINPAFAPEVLLWWLDPGCPACGGNGAQPMGKFVRGLRRCPACHGTRTKPVPYGRAGDRITDRMEEAVNNWRSQTARRLHSTGKAE